MWAYRNIERSDLKNDNDRSFNLEKLENLAEEGWDMVGFDDQICLFKQKNQTEKAKEKRLLEGRKDDDWEVQCKKNMVFEGDENPAYLKGEFYKVEYTGSRLLTTENELGVLEHIILEEGMQDFFYEYFLLYRNGQPYQKL